jgi:hypothetical protein
MVARPTWRRVSDKRARIAYAVYEDRLVLKVSDSDRRSGPAADRLGTALAIGYLLALLCVESLRRATGSPGPAELAANPEAVASGKVWLFVTSAFIVNGPLALELSAAVASSIILIRRHGGLLFWRVAIVSHLGSTLLAYAGVGLLWLSTPDTVGNVVERSDYGISAAWMGVLGALLVSSWRSLAAGRGGRWERFLLFTCAGAAIISFSFFPLLAGIEHVLAFALGVIVLLVAAGAPAPARIETPAHAKARA